jgi:pSer/pThr/pTyr-binding forkhead associated (FHA) protein
MVMQPGTKPLIIAKIIWEDPQNGEMNELLLAEGATVTIGRSDENDIAIKEQHVSRQHAVVQYRDGVFTITDAGSVNGVYVNDFKITEAFPLSSGDVIRLFVPVLYFASVFTDSERSVENSTIITAAVSTGKGKLVISNGPQEGETILLLRDRITVGRATAQADWEVCLQDGSVSRPHARLEWVDGVWVVRDLGSSNGTTVNKIQVTEKGRVLRDGDIVTFGSTIAIFRVS